MIRKLSRRIYSFFAFYKISYFLKNLLSTKKITYKSNKSKKVIISLTSWKDRFVFLPEVLDSLLKQKFKADKIILWLAKEDEKFITQDILSYKKSGIEIRRTENILSFKKLIPALKEFPNDILITVDDDMVYPSDTIMNLYHSYLQKPDSIHANRCRKIKLNNKGHFSPYNESKIIKTSKELTGYDLIFNGVGGVLYPGLNCFSEEVLNNDSFMSLTPNQDDLWFWFMAINKGTKIIKIKNSLHKTSLYTIKGTEFSSLWSNINNDSSESSANDQALKKLIEKYGIPKGLI